MHSTQTMQTGAELRSILRGHEYPVVSIEYFYFSSNIDKSIYTPTLLTFDEKGYMIWWDIMVLRRPIIKLRVHTNSLLSAKQLGIAWYTAEYENPEGSEQDTESNHLRKVLAPKLINKVHNLKSSHLQRFLVTHARDNLLKIWDMYEIYQNQENKEIDHLPILEENVNSVNFCNIDVCEDQLICLNTLNGEFFDIWKISNDVQDGKHSLLLEKRFESIDVSILLRIQKKITFDNKNNATGYMGAFDEILPKKSKLGIIMKLKYLNPSTVLVGFENGWIIALHIPLEKNSLAYLDDLRLLQIENMLNIENLKDKLEEFSKNNQNQQSPATQFAHLLYGDTTSNLNISIIKINTFHYPNPILDITIDNTYSLILTSSVGSKIALFSSNNLLENITKQDDFSSKSWHELKSIGVSCLDIRLDGLIAMNFWNGLVKFYKLEMTEKIEKLEQQYEEKKFIITKTPIKLQKKKSIVTKEFSSNPNDPEIQKGQKQIKRYKSNCVKFCKIQRNCPQLSSSSSLSNSETGFSSWILPNKSSKLTYMKLRRELNTLNTSNFVSIGYDDGSVELYNIDLFD